MISSTGLLLWKVDDENVSTCDSREEWSREIGSNGDKRKVGPSKLTNMKTPWKVDFVTEISWMIPLTSCEVIIRKTTTTSRPLGTTVGVVEMIDSFQIGRAHV